MVKAVIDTNIFIGILLKSKNCLKIRDAFLDGVFDIAISPELLAELIVVAHRPKFKDIFMQPDIKELTELLNSDAIMAGRDREYNPQEYNIPSSCRDRKDNIVLECAAAVKADFIVTGDKDLLELKSFGKTLILTPAQFLKFISR